MTQEEGEGMHSRFLAGWKGLFLAAAVASLVLLPLTGAQAAADTAKTAGGSQGIGPAKGDTDRITLPTLYPRANYQWPYATGPFYGEVAEPQQGAKGVVHLSVGAFDANRGISSIPQQLRTTVKLDQQISQYFLLVVDPAALANGSFDSLKQAIETGGGAIVQNADNSGFVARLTAASYAALEGQPGVALLEPYHPAFRLSPYIGRVPLADPVKALSSVYSLDIQLFPGEDSSVVARALAALGGNVTAVWPDMIKADISREKLADVASLEPVKMVFESVPVWLWGEETTTTAQTGHWNMGAVPYHDAGINGSGGGLIAPNTPTYPQVLMSLDNGIQYDAGDMSDTYSSPGTPSTSHRKVYGYQTVNTFGGSGDLLGCDSYAQGGYTHGEMVAATAMGNGTVTDLSYGGSWAATDPATGRRWKLDGVAPKAKLLAYDAQVTNANAACAAVNLTTGDLAPGLLYTAGAPCVNNTPVPGNGSLCDAYGKFAASGNNPRTYVLAWGSSANPVYGTYATQVDTFLNEHQDAMVFLAAGDDSQDTNRDAIPDPNTVSDPCTAKNAICVGAADNANDGGLDYTKRRAAFSGVGPAQTTAFTPYPRMQPILMAASPDVGTLGNLSEYACRTSDNGQAGVECDIYPNASGTSFSAAAAAGAGMLIRDYFAQGFYPDVTTSNALNAADQVLDASGALVKALLVASADFMNGWDYSFTTLTLKYRLNREQGYGRIQLDKVLPLPNWSASPRGLLVADGTLYCSGDLLRACRTTADCTAAGAGTCTGLGPKVPSGWTTLSGVAQSGVTETFDFDVLDDKPADKPELRIAAAWMDPAGDGLSNNIDLELCAPATPACSGLVYYGNYFTDDNNKSGTLQAGEDCAVSPWETVGVVDNSAWSLPTCANSLHDQKNAVEAIFLSTDPKGNGTASFNQLSVGTWRLKVIGATMATNQPYALVIAGPVQPRSAVKLNVFRAINGVDTQVYTAPVCNDKVQVLVSESADGTDAPGSLTGPEISSRTALEVYASGGVTLLDAEAGLTFTNVGGTNMWTSNKVVLTAGTVPVSGNGMLDVRDGNVVKATYNDKTSGIVDPAKKRFATTSVNCRAAIEFGAATFALYGTDAAAAVNGGCERDARQMFTFGYPDQFMDHGELIDLVMAVRTMDDVDLTDAVASLRAVYHDTDSPVSCKPGTTDCSDPNRTNNTPVPSSILTVLDSPKSIGTIPALISLAVNQYSAPVFAISFAIQMGDPISGKKDVDMLLGISAKKAGKPVEGLSAWRTTLNANETAFYYSTDFPTGGTQYVDWSGPGGYTYDTDVATSNNLAGNAILSGNESIDNPTTFLGDVNNVNDYRFESFVWSDLTAANTRNLNLRAPWNFDSNNGGFTTGLSADTDRGTSTPIANWGEDENFNGVLDGSEDRDPINGVLDQNWSIAGGCGWQTKGGNTYGGIWHTGRIGDPTLVDCMVDGADPGQCQRTDVYPGTDSIRHWWEFLVTPVIQKVHPDLDSENLPVYRTQFTNWAWNAEMDLADSSLTQLTWEFDTDTDKISPVSLTTDAGTFNALTSLFGPVSGGNAPLTNGFPVFANFAAVPGPTTSVNGVVGGNHEGKNACYFEDSGSLAGPFGFALPLDNDAHDGWCLDTTNSSNKQQSCNNSNKGVVCVGGGYNGTCQFDGTTADQFVYKNGPLRNMNLEVVNGWIDGRYYTLEDLYGEDGVNYQAALGFAVYEGSASSQPVKAYGVGVDDMVVEWKEVRLDEDTTTNCANVTTGGSCATLDTAVSQLYSGLTLIDVTVKDQSAGKGAKNDCDHNGAYTDAGDKADCDSDGRRDVYVKAWSDAETAGEWVILNETTTIPTKSGVFRASLPVSAAYDSPGTIFVSKSGTSQPVVTLQYNDPDDGTGNPCKNDPRSSYWGILQAAVQINVDTGSVVVKGSRITNDALKGDGDGFADTNETVNMYITLINKTGQDLTNVVARLASNSSYVDCIFRDTVILGSLAKAATVETTGSFGWKVSASAIRAAGQENADMHVTFNVTLSSDQFDAPLAAQTVIQDLDLDAAGGGNPTTFLESFEASSGLGQFTSMSLDSNMNTNAASNGKRCQYNDPDFANTGSYGEAYCYLGFANDPDNTYDWHIHKTTSSDGGRAYVGSQSLHWGYHADPGDPKYDEYKFSQMDAIVTAAPVNLGGVTGATPELSFKHQISLMDYRRINAPYMQAPDRGIVEMQLADSAGNPVGVWQKISPYENVYDIQPANNYINCTFDPDDDGNNEDSYFDPTDPARTYGPSSTCFPEFIFGSQGNSNYLYGFISGNTNRASDDTVGLQGSINRGTWVQTKFDLARYRGRRVNVRFLTTSIKVYDYTDPIALGFSVGSYYDDGWYIDDVQVSNALDAPATFQADVKASSTYPACPANCTSVTASVTASPTSTGAPGQLVNLDASASAASACISGVLQYQWYANGKLVRDWTDNAYFVDAPTISTTYQVNVRCSTAKTCTQSGSTTVVVGCPSGGGLAWAGPLLVNKTAGLNGAEPDQNLTVTWTNSWTDLIRGDLSLLRTGATYTNSVLACGLSNTQAATLADNNVLATGGGYYFLARGAFCNVAPAIYSQGNTKEKGYNLIPPSRDGQLNADPNDCP
jgi:hypothetical protein